ncbi:MAG: YCF48-related protein [Patescibacteria group bacterium]|nr:YCF48-related protein [Patescibacteria group bacterium]MDD4304459.1 YCF48-related protein [Patescibacteria group bacterium]MDD4695481.1 YCF48-related protein [Patescibacteria group bacterium]
MKIKIRLALLMIPLFLTGCVINFNNGKTSIDSGFFVSFDKGKTWTQKTEFFTVGDDKVFFKTANVTFLKLDPKDPKAIYLGTVGDGLLYTFNSGNGWFKTLSGKGAINDIAIDPKDKCTLYVAVVNKIYKSDDCARNWDEVYVEGLPNQTINAVAVDYFNNNKVYFATSGGGLFKSTDYGKSWSSINWFNNPIKKIIINPKNSSKIYVATNTAGIFKSSDEGATWLNISDVIKDKNKDINSYRDLEIDLTKDDALLYANKYGLFYSADGGVSWKEYKLLTKPNAINIYSIAMNPNNAKEIYYTTAKALYKSSDGGDEWTNESLKTSKTPVDMMISPLDSNIIFIGVREIKK